jgi:membrane associated rhomboid family serine protease
MNTLGPSARGSRQLGLALVACMVLLMWVGEAVDLVPGVDLDQYGLRPRDPDGLVGIGTSPFLHAGFGHLASNTIPFLLMGFVIALGGAMRVLLVTAIVALVGGLGTWLLAPGATLHVGASGLVFGYAGYLLSRGFFNRRALDVAVAVMVALVWGGGLLVGLLPQAGVSWQGHLFGAVGGVVAGRVLAPSREAGGIGA